MFSEPGQRGSLTMVCTCSRKVRSSRAARPRPETTCPSKATSVSRGSGRENPFLIIVPLYYSTMTRSRTSLFMTGRREPYPPWEPQASLSKYPGIQLASQFLAPALRVTQRARVSLIGAEQSLAGHHLFQARGGYSD